MRILSQEKLGLNYDIPYEQVCLNTNKKSENSFRIYAWHITTDSDDGCYLIAEYSTESKARKAMEMLRNFNEVREVRNIPIKNDVIETMFEPLKKLFKIYTDGGGEFLKMDLVKVGDYFQFPADDEMEV